jgi:hypothetical protein
MKTEPSHEGAASAPPPASAARVWLSRALRAVLAVAILAAGAGVALYWLRNRPTAQRRPPEPKASLVRVTPVRRTAHPVVVRAMGTVEPAVATMFSPEVGGHVVAVAPAFVPGGLLSEGEEILRIEDADYALDVQRLEAELRRQTSAWDRAKATVALREADVVKAKAALQIELGQQAVARRESELLGRELAPEDMELVLRQPELRTAEATVAAAEAALRAAETDRDAAGAAVDAARSALERARLDLSRTSVSAPFNAIVKTRTANLATQVSPSAPVAELCGSDTYWVRLTVPVAHLKWIRIPQRTGERGSGVRIYHASAWGEGVYREGEVLRLGAGVEPEGRLASLLVAVDDPLDLEGDPPGRRRLMLDDYVRAEIDGRTLEGVVRIERTALREGRRVWVMTADDALEIRPVEIAWSDAETVFVAEGLADGERLVTSDLGAPVEGMALRTASEAPDAPVAPATEEPGREVAAAGPAVEANAPDAGAPARGNEEKGAAAAPVATEARR